VLEYDYVIIMCVHVALIIHLHKSVVNMCLWCFKTWLSVTARSHCVEDLSDNLVSKFDLNLTWEKSEFFRQAETAKSKCQTLAVVWVNRFMEPREYLII
jgi:hypothetical protein